MCSSHDSSRECGGLWNILLLFAPHVYIFTIKHRGKTGHVFGLACATRNRGREQTKREMESKREQKLALSCIKTDAVAAVPKNISKTGGLIPLTSSLSLFTPLNGCLLLQLFCCGRHYSSFSTCHIRSLSVTLYILY